MRSTRSTGVTTVALVLVAVALSGSPVASAACPDLPPDNIWNARVDELPTHPLSGDYVSRIGATGTVHADFGSGVWPPGSTSPIGIPFVEVDASQADVPVVFTSWPGESDPGPYPIPADAAIEGGPDSTGDRHVIVVDTAGCRLYELFDAQPTGGGAWEAANGAAYDLTSNALRPDGWTSADAAGLPIYPGLVRYDEILAGEITHAIRFTAPQTQKAHVWPARHDASNITDSSYPPMGQRFRLKPSFDVSGYSAEARIILNAMKAYGIVLADNGSPWFISGAPDERWDNDALHELHDVRGSDFEAVDVSSLMVDPDSGAVGNHGAAKVTVVGGPNAVGPEVIAGLFSAIGAVERVSGSDRYATAAALSRATSPPGVAVVFVATGESHPDALAAGPVAARLGAPILLVRRDSIPVPTSIELARLDPASIVVVGGTAAVTDEVLEELGSHTVGSVGRLSGSDRYATAAAISRWHFAPGVPVVYVADGVGFADALAAGAAAARTGGPVLLTRGTALPTATAIEISRLSPSSVVIVGGPAAISPEVEADLVSLGPWSVERVAGSNRYATATAIASHAFPDADHAFVATGSSFPDALAAVSAAGQEGAPVLLVPRNELPAAIASELTRLLGG